MTALADADLREIAKSVIVETFRAVADRFDGRELAANALATEGLPDSECRRVAQLVDSAFVEVEVDWLGGTPLDRAELAYFDDPVRLVNEGIE